jgi:tRNA (cytidine32/uridine32-2'-O)-methyltransferase
MNLENIKIILVEPQNPGNIGATARAMKTMGLNQLVLINPMHFPHKDAYIRATNATDVLENCTIADTLSEVISDCKLVIGTSTRDRGGYIPTLTARETAVKIIQEIPFSSIALIFGTESHGMSGKDIRLCNYCGYIPTNPGFSSLNLAAAVQTFCYEIFQQKAQETALQNANPQNIRTIKDYPSNKQLDYFYQQLENTLYKSGFIRRGHPGLIIQRLRALFNRARLESKEINILQGILASINNHLK